ncbi:MAG TPA: DUF2157 domain-containing protein [Allosphingosinicella sp.]|nr:DUF2157 domain-containing protein [Allosphingosinicella sp.]
MSRYRGEMLDWLAAGRVSPGRERSALRSAGLVPDSAEWRVYLGQLTLWLGTMALAAAIIFFFAFNWDSLGRLAKFGLVEAAILAALIAAWRLDLDAMAGKATLTLLALLVGALLALTGQIYQTGADSWTLFAWWAVLILPWVLVGRFAPLWLLWLALLNLGAWLYFSLASSGDTLLWVLLALDGLALVAWEAGHRSGIAWLGDTWPPRLAAIASGVMATALAIWAIFDGGPGLLGWAAWIGLAYFWYRHVRRDLFVLAGGVLSFIVTVVAFLSRFMLESASGGYLFIGLAVIGLSAGGAIWLNGLARAPAS